MDLFAVRVRRGDLYTDRGVSGARAIRPEFGRALTALEKGDTLVVTTLDRLGRSTENMLSLSAELRGRGINLNVLNLGRGTVDTATPMGGITFTVSQDRNARRLIDGGQPGTQVANDLGMSRATLYRRMAQIEAREWIGLQAE